MARTKKPAPKQDEPKRIIPIEKVEEFKAILKEISKIDYATFKEKYPKIHDYYVNNHKESNHMKVIEEKYPSMVSKIRDKSYIFTIEDNQEIIEFLDASASKYELNLGVDSKLLSKIKEDCEKKQTELFQMMNDFKNNDYTLISKQKFDGKYIFGHFPNFFSIVKYIQEWYPFYIKYHRNIISNIFGKDVLKYNYPDFYLFFKNANIPEGPNDFKDLYNHVYMDGIASLVARRIKGDIELEELAKGQKKGLLFEEAANHTWQKIRSNVEKIDKMSDIDEEYDNVEKIEMFNSIGRNIIFYGAPGTGKSHIIKKITDGRVQETILSRQLSDLKKGKVFRTTFHPDTDYASFVGSYKPVKNGTSITYSFRDQVFLKACIYAWQHLEEQVYLVIEEINRGNCAQIFGDVFQLLDRIDDVTDSFNGFSNYAILPDSDIEELLEPMKANPRYNEYLDYLCIDNHVEEEKSEEKEPVYLALPGNLTILASMNTSDQSLFPMDSAFKRRWEWKHVPINYNAEELSDWFLCISDSKFSWIEVLKNINLYIRENKRSADKLMGEFFIKAKNKVIQYEEFRDKVLFYLFNDAFRGDKRFFEENFIFEDLFGDDKESMKKVCDWLRKLNCNEIQKKEAGI